MVTTMKGAELKLKVASAMRQIKNRKGIYLFISPAADYNTININIIKTMVTKWRTHGIYVTLNKPYPELLKNLKAEKIKPETMYFIDGVSKGAQKIVATNCTYLESANSLTELSLAITAAANTGKFKFLFFDSLSTLLIYNDIKTTEKFSYYLLSKLKNYDLCGVIISLDEENSNKLLPVISQFCDGSFEIK
ncbi:hypothetical protein HY492_01685 [Candidatus Woesearchaeota archaeon]|nr:hypothetical protein [Candidatus Woesearchaeota archaeon]